MVKVEFAPNAMPLPVKVQLPDVVADPKGGMYPDKNTVKWYVVKEGVKPVGLVAPVEPTQSTAGGGGEVTDDIPFAPFKF
jgi:hypothetical protein